MYKVTFSEFMQYRMAERRLNEMKLQHEAELQQAYDNIKPTITAVNYDLGQMYAESIDPAEYAIYLVELQEKHEQQQSYWRERTEVFKRALQQLDEQERQNINDPRIRHKLIDILSGIVAGKPNLRRNYKPLHDDLKQYDEQIESMNEAELLQDYEDFTEIEALKDKCIKLYEVHDMTYKQVAETVGITRQRAERIIKQHRQQKEMNA